MASDDDLSARFTSSPGNPVLAAHQLVAELAQLYYERPNGVSPRAVLAVAPASWTDDPPFVDALLGALDGNPVVQAVTTSQAFALFPTPVAVPDRLPADRRRRCRDSPRRPSAPSGHGSTGSPAPPSAPARWSSNSATWYSEARPRTCDHRSRRPWWPTPDSPSTPSSASSPSRGTRR